MVGTLNFKNISLEDKETFNKYFLNNQNEISEYSFTNLFVWRNSRAIEFAEYKNGLIILADTGNEKYFMPPIGFENLREITGFLLDYGIINNITNSVKRISESGITSIENSGFNIIEDRDNFDYVYASNDLALLKGRKYSSKRNFVTNFLNEYDYQYIRYEKKYFDNCLELCEIWMNKKNPDDKSIYNEYTAIKELLINADKLDAIGGVLIIDNKVEAFAFGEKLNDDTFVTHFEKANLDYKGIFQVINKLFIEDEVLGKFDYVNREQDLGISGIRQAKESYFPVRMIKKYIVTNK
jgi:uncharacterized protein